MAQLLSYTLIPCPILFNSRQIIITNYSIFFHINKYSQSQIYESHTIIQSNEQVILIEMEGLFIQTIDTSHSDKNTHAQTLQYSIMRTASQINNRLHRASQRLSEIEHSKSMTKGKYNKLPKGSQSLLKPLSFDTDKEHERNLQELLNQKNTIIRNYKQRIENLEDVNSKLQHQNVKQQQKYLRMEKKYILQINRLCQLLERDEQKQLEYEESKFDLEKIVERERTKNRKLEAELQNTSKMARQSKKNMEAIKKLKKKYHDIYPMPHGQLAELLQDIDKNLEFLLNSGEQKSKNRKGINKFFDKQLDQSDKENTWNPNTIRNNSMKFSLNTNVPMKQSIILKEEIPIEQMTDISQFEEDLYRMLVSQAQAVEKLI